MSVSYERLTSLSQFAESYNNQLQDCEKEDMNRPGSSDHVIEAKKCSQNFLNEALKLPQEERKALLMAAQERNDFLREHDPVMPALNIVFNASTEKLAEFHLTYFHFPHTNYEATEGIDFYRP